MYPRGVVRLTAIAALFSFGCVVADVPIEGKPCPCPDGYACHDGTCVQGTPSGSGGAGGSSNTTSTTGTGPCRGLCGTDGCSPCPEVAVVDAGGFGIDATEVPREAYALFLADAVDPATQSSRCTWNTSFLPREDITTFCEGPYDMSAGRLPITCVDWCDAAAYCTWAGKHLCGRIGGVATLAIDELDDPAESEWYRACSAGGTKLYPYSDTFDDNACNTIGNASDVRGVGDQLTCEGGFPGVFDMVGNAEEWEDSCDIGQDPAADNCYVRGGAFWGDQVEATCLHGENRRPDRSTASNDWSFRCCSEL